MVGADVREGLVDGGVVFGGDERVLEAVPFRRVVVNVVGGNETHTRVSLARRASSRFRAVSPRIRFCWKLHEDGVRPEPIHVVVEEFLSIIMPTIQGKAR